MQKRKTKIIDGKDKEILKVLFSEKLLVGRQIARRVGITAAAVAPRLHNMEELGFLKRADVGELRSFDKELNGHLVKVKSPKHVMWALDIKY
jgi:DNA-binding Lrp family transcriptional regulator